MFCSVRALEPVSQITQKLGKEAGDLDQKDVVEFVKMKVGSKVGNRVEIGTENSGAGEVKVIMCDPMGRLDNVVC